MFTFIPLYTFDVATNDVLVESNGVSIGHIEAKYIPRFQAGAAAGLTEFRPNDDWKNTFSTQLIKTLNLS